MSRAELIDELIKKMKYKDQLTKQIIQVNRELEDILLQLDPDNRVITLKTRAKHERTYYA